MNVIIADIDNEVILGLDFLRNMNCKIDVSQKTLVIQDQTTLVDCLGYVGCSRTVGSEMVQIYPMSEKIINETMVELTLENGQLCIFEHQKTLVKMEMRSSRKP